MNHLSQPYCLLRLLQLHSPHVLLHIFHKASFGSSFPPARWISLQHPPPYIILFPPLCFAKSPQPHLSRFAPKLISMCCQFNYVASNSVACHFIIGSVSISMPYNLSGLTTVLWLIPFVLADTFLPQINFGTLFHLLHPDCTLSLLFCHTPSLCTFDPKYLS